MLLDVTDILLFRIFKKAWNTIQLEHFESVMSEVSTLNEIEHISTFALKQLEGFQLRYDYGELLSLNIIFLGGVPKKKKKKEYILEHLLDLIVLDGWQKPNIP